jgi:hypothetical protein
MLANPELSNDFFNAKMDNIQTIGGIVEQALPADRKKVRPLKNTLAL